MHNITKKSRQALYADKYAFDPEEMIPINALDLIAELVEQDRLSAENKILKERIEVLEALLVASRATSKYTVYDIKGRLS